MKRSRVNRLIDEAIDVLDRHQIRLPRFAYWSPAEWAARGPECDEIRQCKLGWDVTDFGSERFEDIGLVVFTLRNGHHNIAPYTNKPYGEKILLSRENQRTPMHYHTSKSEDIICKGGGNLLIRLFNRAPGGGLADSDVEVSLDGIRRRVPAGHVLRLEPGDSITLTPTLYHEFWAEPGTGMSIAGEVSSINDDDSDNTFFDSPGRFPKIEEDVSSTHRLCIEY